MALFDFLSVQAVLLAWFLHMFMGMVWYSTPVFGRAFLRLAYGNNKVPKPDPNAMFAAALGTATAMPFFCFVLSVAGCKTAGEGALWGSALGLFFDSGLNASHNFFEERPFALFVLHRGYHAVSLSLIGAVLGACCGSA